MVAYAQLEAALLESPAIVTTDWSRVEPMHMQ
jgi:hypothetical protein